MLATVASLALANWARFALPFGKPPTALGLFHLPVYLIVVLIWSTTFWALSAYDPRRILDPLREAQRLVVAITAALLLLAGVLFFSYRGLSRLLLAYFYLLDLFLVILARALWRLAFKTQAHGREDRRRVLILGAGVVGQELAEKLTQKSWVGLDVVGYLDDDLAKQGTEVAGRPVLGTLDQAAALIEKVGVDEVVLALPLHAYQRMRALVTEMQQLPVHIKVVPDFFALTFFAAKLEELDGIPLIGLKEPVISGTKRLAKRIMDLILGVICLLVFGPLMLIIALLIKLDSRGPVLFEQGRVGENGRVFKMLKFRTMHVGAEQEQEKLLERDKAGHLVFKKTPDDPRVTRLGRYLRRMSLDELPQLFNVLRGEMSLVGPRPELPFLVELYEPWQWQRFSVPQGMTGWWQIHDRSDSPMHLHMADDLYYIQNYSLLLDLKILWYTIGAVLRGRGAY
jgi:exopolysaccharide biosynthesis polyprenyl glycosylphosphotransferase